MKIVGFHRSPEQKIDSKIRTTASLALDLVMDSLDETDKEVFRVNVGRAPKPLSSEEFMDRVGFETVALLGQHGIAPFVEYDHDRSKQATDEFEAIKLDQPIPKGSDGVRLVFTRRPFPPATA